LSLILASASPQRSAILEQLGVEFTVEPTGVDEVSKGEPSELVVENALRKARAVSGARVLGADTAVVIDGIVYGKPRDSQQARRFLERLAGRKHHVWSGIALVEAGGEERTSAAVTHVTFRELTPAQLEWYLGTGEWRDRAGAYSDQGRGAALVERIEGDFWNVVGLPVPELLRLVPDLLGWQGFRA
jgi:septum formation protein